MLRATIVAIILATAFSVNANAAVVWDGSLTIANVPAAACGGFKQGWSFPTVFRPKIGSTNPENSQINIFLYRSALHIMTNSTTSQFGGAGTWAGLLVMDSGLVRDASGNFSAGVLSPTSIVAGTPNFDFSVTLTYPGCSLQLRGGFTKRP